MPAMRRLPPLGFSISVTSRARVDLPQPLSPAMLIGEGAARVEEAAGGPVVEAGDDARNGLQPVLTGAALGQRREESGGVGVLRRLEQLIGAALLDHLPGIHDRDALRRLGDDP